MRLLTQPNKWTCLPTSVAMLMNVSLDDIFKYLGHDGSDIVWPHLSDPQNRRAFHIQEMIDFALEGNYLLTPIEQNPMFANSPESAFESLGAAINHREKYSVLRERYAAVQSRLHQITRPRSMESYLADYDGLLIGLGSRGRPHAAAWNCKENVVYDPCGERLLITSFTISTFWIFNHDC
jgi:hypothetical protein